MTQETEVKSVFDLFREVAGHLDIIEALYNACGGKSLGLYVEEVQEAVLGFTLKRRTSIEMEEDLRSLRREGWAEPVSGDMWRLPHEKALLIQAMNVELRNVVHLIELGRPRGE